jgi:hypothetical protein
MSSPRGDHFRFMNRLSESWVGTVFRWFFWLVVAYKLGEWIYLTYINELL